MSAGNGADHAPVTPRFVSLDAVREAIRPEIEELNEHRRFIENSELALQVAADQISELRSAMVATSSDVAVLRTDMRTVKERLNDVDGKLDRVLSILVSETRSASRDE